MKDCPTAKDLGTFDAERLKQIGLNLTSSLYLIQTPKKEKGREDAREQNKGPRCNMGPGYWWLCGDGKARKSLPLSWKGHCTRGYLTPGASIHEGTSPLTGLLRTPWIRFKRAENPLVIRGTGFHSFVRWLIPSLGVSELEKAIVNISATVETLENLTLDAI